MDFAYSDDQQLARDNIIRFARAELNRALNTSDHDEFPRDQWMKAGEVGLLGLAIPEQYGGGGLDAVSTAAALDALGYACADHGFVHAICTQILCAIHINEYGSDEQKAAVLPGACSGDIVLAQAITEPSAGSDTSAIKLTAVESDGHYLLNGSKTFTTNGPIADLVIVYAVTDPTRKVLGRSSCFLVDTAAQGFERGRPLEKMGLNTMKNGELFFADCKIPQDTLLGRKGAAGAMFSAGMNWERVLLFATFSGKLERIIEKSVEYSKDRQQFGVPISSYQSISHKIADMRVNLELARLAVYKAAWMIDEGQPAALNAAIAKLFASEAVRSACLDAVQVQGGYGFMAEGEVERELRDSIGGTIYSGTSEIQRNIIAKLCGL